jgi:pantoate--beta-alanine ligase
VAVIAQMARDLNIDVALRVVPTVRDADGLALSSRNARLTGDERVRARAVPRAISAGLAAHRTGGDPVRAARDALRELDVDYVAVADWGTGPTLAVAVRVGSTRLIDNAPLDAKPPAGRGL